MAAGETGRVDVRLVAVPVAPLPPTPEPVDPQRVYENVAGKVDTLAKKLSGSPPSYPSSHARRLKREERVSVVVRFVVTETGEVVVAPRANSLSGLVINDQGQPVSNATVILTRRARMGEDIANEWFMGVQDQPRGQDLDTRTGRPSG